MKSRTIAHATALALGEQIRCTIRRENTSIRIISDEDNDTLSPEETKTEQRAEGEDRGRNYCLLPLSYICQSFQIHGGYNAATERIDFISIHASVCPLRHYSKRTTGFVIAVRKLTVFLYAVFLGLYNIKWLSLANNWLGTRD